MIDNAMSGAVIRIARIWRLTIPRGWQYEKRQQKVVLYHPDGVGAVTISTMRAVERADADPASVIEIFAAGNPVTYEDARETPTGCRAIAVGRFEKNGFSWIVAAAIAARSMLVLSYNCRPEMRGREDANVHSLLGSIVVEEGNRAEE